jgi:hypothetical protein
VQGTRTRNAWTWGWRVWAACMVFFGVPIALQNGPRGLTDVTAIGKPAGLTFMFAVFAYWCCFLEPPPPPRRLGPRIENANRWAAFASPFIAAAGIIDELIALNALSALNPTPPHNPTGPAIAAVAPPLAAAAIWLAGYFSLEPRDRPHAENDSARTMRAVFLWGIFPTSWTAMAVFPTRDPVTASCYTAAAGAAGALMGAAWLALARMIRRRRR